MKPAAWLLIAASFYLPAAPSPEGTGKTDALPARWHLTIEFRLSPEALKAVSENSTRPDHPVRDFALLSVGDTGYVRGYAEPIELRKGVEPLILQATETSPFAPIPNLDLTNIHRMARSMIVLSDQTSTRGLDAPTNGVAVRFGMSGPNGRRVAVFRSMPTKVLFPEAPKNLLTLLNRDLPESYRRIFEYLRIPTAAPVDPTNPAPYGVCDVHGSALELETVPIVYGLPWFDPVQMKAEEALFPNSGRNWSAGCVFGPASPKRAPMRFCPACRDAEDRWLFRQQINERQRHPKIENRRW